MSYLTNVETNNLKEIAMSRKLPADWLEWIENTIFTTKCVKNYNGSGNNRYFFKVDLEYSEELRCSRNELPFLPEEMKTDKYEKLIYSLNYKDSFVAQQETCNEMLMFKKVDSAIKFNNCHS